MYGDNVSVFKLIARHFRKVVYSAHAMPNAAQGLLAGPATWTWSGVVPKAHGQDSQPILPPASFFPSGSSRTEPGRPHFHPSVAAPKYPAPLFRTYRPCPNSVVWCQRDLCCNSSCFCTSLTQHLPSSLLVAAQTCYCPCAAVMC